MEYWLALEGAGEGCDYTIGCNKNLHKLKATNAEDAVLEATRMLGPDWYGDLNTPDEHEGYKIEKATILVVWKTIEIPIDALRAEVLEAIDKENIALQETAERAKLAELQAKYGNG